MCKCGQYWSCNVISSFWSITQQEVGKCIIISTPNSDSILVFFFPPESDVLYLLGSCFNVQTWPVLVLQCHFEFLMYHSAGNGGVYRYFNTQLWLKFGVLFFSLKAIIYTLQYHVSMFQCSQYWPYNFISKLQSFTQVTTFVTVLNRPSCTSKCYKSKFILDSFLLHVAYWFEPEPIDEWRTTISWFLESWDGCASFINWCPNLGCTNFSQLRLAVGLGFPWQKESISS